MGDVSCVGILPLRQAQGQGCQQKRTKATAKCRQLFAAAGVAVDGALFIAGRAVVFLLGDGGEVGGVVLGGHGDGAEEETGEGGVLVENFAALGVDVEEVEGGWG